MKQITSIILALILASGASAQEVKTGRFRKAELPESAKTARYGSTRHEIIYKKAGQRESLGYDLKEKESFQPEAATKEPVQVKIDGMQMLVLQPDGTYAPIRPNGDRYYVWASVSPDNTRLLYTAAGAGTFVCDRKGRIVHDLASLNAPEWVNDRWVIGMQDKDDGHRFTESEVVMVHLPSGKTSLVTARTEKIALYPSVSPDQKRVLFNTPAGEVYTARIRIRE